MTNEPITVSIAQDLIPIHALSRLADDLIAALSHKSKVQLDLTGLSDADVIILAGLIAIPQLPVARFPSIAPPSVTITATYPGATPQTMNDGVVVLIERELSSVKNLLYFESTTDTSGLATITATFRPGTDPDLAQVDVQNRLKTVEPRLPQTVRQLGVNVEAASSGFLMMVSLTSENGSLDEVALGDYSAATSPKN